MDNIVHADFTSPAPAGGGEVVLGGPIVPTEQEEVTIYKRDAVAIVAGWLGIETSDLHAYQKHGRCFLDYPGNLPDERIIFTGPSWWNVLRKVTAALLHDGVLAYWCLSHDRWAEENGKCDPELGGLLLPCRCEMRVKDQ